MNSTTKHYLWTVKIVLSLAFTVFAFDGSVIGRVQDTDNQKAGTELFSVKVSAGDFDRENTVVDAKIWYEGIEIGDVTLSDGKGLEIPAQITGASFSDTYMKALKQKGDVEDTKTPGRIRFVLPQLAAGKTLTLSGTRSKPDKSKYEWHDDGSAQAELQFDGKPVVKYMYEPVDDSTEERRAETYKVFHHVYSPDGSRLLTKGAGGKFPHHRGIFFGFNRISYGDGNSADTWHCREKASQISQALVNQTSANHGRTMSVIQWNGKDGEPFAIENRQLDITKVDGATMIDFRTLLTSLVGKIKLDGDPQHAGVQFRASQEVPDKTAKATYYLRPDGKAEPGKFRNWSNKKNESDINKAHINLPWHAVSFELPNEGKNSRYTVCYLDSADNPKPARFSERDYARFGSYFVAEIDVEKPLSLHYRYWIFDGELEVADVQKLSDQFANPVSVELVK